MLGSSRGLLWLGLVLFLAVSAARAAPGPRHGVEIRRTTDGIPHIRAGDWLDLGRGIGYAQAEDALCTLAEAFVTYAGKRSLYFGADGKPQANSTFGQSSNRQLDFFFKAFVDDHALTPYRQLPAPMRALAAGFAEGYNRYLGEARTGKADASQRACLRQAWVGDITREDVYRRMYAAQLAGGWAHFIPELVQAEPPLKSQAEATAERASGQPDPDARRALARRLASRMGDDASAGSNAMAFGSRVTGEQGAVLFGNPHWYWSGPDRFYQMHLTIPGQLNVAGAGFLGVPLVMIGFNEHVAWTHTVSAARRFGVFQLQLDPDDPRQYLLDGKRLEMRQRQVAIDVRSEDGHLGKESRTFYSSRLGPLVDLSAWDKAMGWGAGRALALQDINASNYRVFAQFFEWNRAQSLDAFIGIQKRFLAMPWVNTVAIGKNDGRVWYADAGAVPNVPDQLKERCATDLARAFTQTGFDLPFLDGSRSACQWPSRTDTPLAGQLPWDQQPHLLRRDYVANMNNSYWLSNVYQPLTGYAKVMGGEAQDLLMRPRLGHEMALEQVAHPVSSSAALSERLRHDLLVPRVYSAERYLGRVLDLGCLPDSGDAARDPRESQLGQACNTLSAWSRRADAQDRGVLLWERTWQHLTRLLTEKYGPEAFAVPFDPVLPLDTPDDPRLDEHMVRTALGAAIADFAKEDLALDQPLARQRYVQGRAGRIAMYGGCDEFGYFMVFCGEGAQMQDANILGNTYMQMVHFDGQGVRAYTLLAHGLDDDALRAGHAEAGPAQASAPVERYAQKQWLDFPFSEAQILRDPNLKRSVLSWPAR